MGKKLKLFLIGALLLAGGYVVLNILMSKHTYKVGGQRGYSNSVQESKERGVFIKELNYRVLPSNLKLNSDFVFFIEKGFNYGKNSVFITDSLTEEGIEFPYQLIVGCINPCEKFKSCDYDCDEKKHRRSDTLILLESSSKFKLELTNEFIRDTITYDILYNTLQSYKVDTIGKIKVWDEVKNWDGSR